MEFPTLATKFEHEVLGNEYCSGYTDHFNQWNTGFYCPQTGSSLAVYCCGTPVFKYCCTAKPTDGLSNGLSSGGGGRRRENDGGGSGGASIYVSDTPVIIGIVCGVLAVLVILVIVFSCCLVHKKRSHVPGGMYRMEESSTTSFHHAQQTQTQQQTLLPNHKTHSNSTSTSHHSNLPGTSGSNTSCTENHTSRPIMSIQPQQIQQKLLKSTFHPPPVLRSNSLGGSISPNSAWNRGGIIGDDDSRTIPGRREPIFHINASHPRISSSIHNGPGNSILPPPARFSSNQNLPNYVLGDRSNPREIQKLYEYGPTSSPYGDRGGDRDGGAYLPVNHPSQNSSQSQYGPISPTSYYANHNQYFPSQKMNNAGVITYCTSTLPSSLRRSGSGSASISSITGGVRPQPPLKSILRNPLIPQNSVGGICYPYGPQSHPQQENINNVTTPIRSYTPMSLGGGSGSGRRITTEDFDFGESLLASGSGSDEQEQHSYDSYNFPDYSLRESGNNASGATTIHPTSYSPGPEHGRYSSAGNPTTEYQNDINRLDNSDLDPESLSRLIELDMDMDSKL